jgi:hypothetical protein
MLLLSLTAPSLIFQRVSAQSLQELQVVCLQNPSLQICKDAGFQGCPSGQHISPEGTCVDNTPSPVTTCPSNQHLEDDKCVSNEVHCDSDSIKKGNECVKITDEFKNQGQCVKSSHQSSSEVSKDTCKSAFKSKDK